MSSATSKSIGKYEIVGLISKGVRSSIYRGVDIDTRRNVAIKVLKRSAVDLEALPAFRKQSQSLARLDHPSMAAFFDVVDNDKAFGLVSEVCDGKAIAGLLREGAHPEIKSVWDIVRPMLEALAAAHALGATHRDLKPSKMILAPDGRVRVTDFGVSALLTLPLTERHYHAPEQWGEGPVGSRTDVYQAATIVYQLITGKLPFTGTPEELEHRIAQERPADPSSFDNRIAWQLDWVIQKALSKDPIDRFPSAAEFADGLRLGLQETVAKPLEPAVIGGRRAANDPVPKLSPPATLSLSFLEGEEEEEEASAPAPQAAPGMLSFADLTAAPAPVAAPAPPAAKKPAAFTLELEPRPESAAPAPAAAPPPTPAPEPAPKPAAAATPPAAAAPATVASVTPPDNGKPRILFVDDDERILNALRALFRADYQVSTATNGEAALEIVNRGGLHVVVSDQRMPGLTGVELLRKVRAASPNSLRLLLTGYTDMASLVGSINEGEIFRFVKKPWDNTELRNDIAEAVKVALERAKAPAVPEPAAAAVRSAGSLLVIDPKEGLARGLERLLAGEAEVIQVTTPAEAARAMHAQEIAAIVADMGAGMDGLVALFKQVKAKRPNVLTILLSDEPDSELGIELINKAQIFRFLPKPVSAKELRHNVAEALRRYAAARSAGGAEGAPGKPGDDAASPALARSA